MKKILAFLILINIIFITSCGRKANSKKLSELGKSDQTYQIALQYEMSGEKEKAIDLYHDLVATNPYNVDAVKKLYQMNKEEGLMYFNGGQFKKAISYLDVAYKFYKTKELKQKLVDSMIYVQENTEKKKEKIDLLEKVLLIDTENIGALKKIASLIENDDPEKAVAYYSKLSRLAPDDEGIKLRISRLNQMTGNDTQEISIDAIENAENLDFSDEDYEFYFKRAKEVYDAGDIKKAAKIYNLLLPNSKSPEHTSLFVKKLIEANYLMKNYTDNLVLYSKYEADAVSDNRNAFFILLSYLELGKADQFYSLYQKLSNRLAFEKNQELYMIFKYHLAKDDKESVESMIEDIKANGDDEFTARILNELALYFAHKADYRSAIFYLTQEKAYSESPEIWFNEGIFLDKVKEYKKALQVYKKAVDMSPETPKYYYYYILSLKRNRKYDEMETQKNIVLQKFKNSKWADYVKRIFGERDMAGNVKMFSDFESYYNYGIEFAKNGEFEKAVYNFKMAYRLQPENFNILINIGNVYFTMGKYDEAIPFYIKAEEFSKNNSYIKFFLGKCYVELKLFDEAKDQIRESYNLDEENVDALKLLEEIKDEESIADTRFESLKKIGISSFNEDFVDISYGFFKKAYEIKHDDIFILTSLVNILMKKQLDEEAEKYLKRLVGLYGSDYDALKLSYNFYKDRDKEKAIRILESMKALFPEEKSVYLNLVKELKLLNKKEKALEITDEVKQRFPQDFKFHEELTKELEN
ncbi:MAG: hypothetical protein C0601_04000 [Candidatus Muiribacterium halophilum]|uniref:Tetratricopeptide repeat protein n=1 Tax=Muiribacterium halophilum TaxID=2053465 RepID=A0A2N5ZJC8_MUIH1|nr:MAG: hypothetical protein C0601_04000 [Candidatus Muirbacterium halophilum]